MNKQNVCLECGWWNPICHCESDTSNLTVDTTIGKYSESLGVYVESSSHLRQIAKERGLESFNRVEELHSMRAQHENERSRTREQEIRQLAERALYVARR